MTRKQFEILAHSLGVPENTLYTSLCTLPESFYRGYFQADEGHRDYQTLTELVELGYMVRKENLGVMFFIVTIKGKEAFRKQFSERKKFKQERWYERAPVLHLNLKRKWFDMIRSGEKREEYREIKPYWNRMFKPQGHIRIGLSWLPFSHVKVVFSNGYAKDRPQFAARITGMRFNSEGRPEWGAEAGKRYFVLEIEVLKQ